MKRYSLRVALVVAVIVLLLLGAAETIDITIGGTDPAAGVGVAYIVYTRVQ